VVLPAALVRPTDAIWAGHTIHGELIEIHPYLFGALHYARRLHLSPACREMISWHTNAHMFFLLSELIVYRDELPMPVRSRISDSGCRIGLPACCHISFSAESSVSCPLHLYQHSAALLTAYLKYSVSSEGLYAFIISLFKQLDISALQMAGALPISR